MISIIVAHELNRGIGMGDKIPWFIPGELAWVAKTTKSTTNPNKKNALIMGRKTWFSIPEERRPLAGRLNIVVSSTMSTENNNENFIVLRSLDEAFEFVSDHDKIENAFVFGGSSIYTQAINNPLVTQLNITQIKEGYTCDTYFPVIPSRFHLKSVAPVNYEGTTVRRLLFESELE